VELEVLIMMATVHTTAEAEAALVDLVEMVHLENPQLHRIVLRALVAGQQDLAAALVVLVLIITVALV
jgi:hypothetical protein